MRSTLWMILAAFAMATVVGCNSGTTEGSSGTSSNVGDANTTAKPAPPTAAPKKEGAPAPPSASTGAGMNPNFKGDMSGGVGSKAGSK